MFFFQDIRSFFNAKPKSKESPPLSVTKRKSIVFNSDSDDDTKNHSKSEKKSIDKLKHKKRRVIASSDEEAEDKNAKSRTSKPSLSNKLAKNASTAYTKMKPFDVGNLFGDEPERIEKVKTKTNKEKDLLNDRDDDLMEIDEKLLSSSPKKSKSSRSKIEIPSKAENESPKKIKTEVKSTPNDDRKQNSRTPKSNKKSTTKKEPKNDDLNNSAYDDDQERFERKRAAAALYKSFQNRAGPSNPGSKEIPNGKDNCLAGLTFVLTGVYESMEKDEAAQVIKDFGGRVTGSISGKTNYLVSGEESGPKKLARADELNIIIITEDGLLDLIREKSGMPTKGKKQMDSSPETKKHKIEVKVEKDVKVKKETKTPEKKLSPIKKQSKISEPLVSVSIKEEKISPKLEDLTKVVSLAWVDKYKPKTIKDIIGQQGAASNVEK